MIYGYIRTASSDNPSAGQQCVALQEHGCSKLFTDIGISDTAVVRPEWEALCETVQSCDCVVLQNLTILSRNVGTLLEDLSALWAQQVDVLLLDEGIDTRTPQGAGAMQLALRLAQLNAINRDYARALPNEEPAPRGRPSSISDAMGAQIEAELAEGETITAVARIHNVSRAAIYRWCDGK